MRARTDRTVSASWYTLETQTKSNQCKRWNNTWYSTQ